MNRALIIGALVAVTVVFAQPAFSASPSSRATAFVRDLSTEAVQVLSSEGAGLAEREAKFQTLLSTRFDVRVIGRFALGRYWRRASTAQRKEYLELFGDYIVKTYSTKLGGYSGHQFTIVSERALDNKTDTLVNSRIERPSGPPVNVTWRVRFHNNNQRIIDVMVEGISMALSQRQQFASVVSKYGLQGLLETLRARTTKLSARR